MSEFTNNNTYGVPRQAGYEGATTSYRLEQRGLSQGDQDTTSARELKNLWARSHYLVRNNACSITAKKRLLANWVGKGITVKWMNPNNTPNKKFQKLWDTWIQECNYDGYGNLYTTEALWGSALFESGESLTQMVISKRPTSKIPLALKVVESEQLDPMFTKVATENVGIDPMIPAEQDVRTGIGFIDGKPITYYFWKKHPGSRLITVPGNIRVAVPAEDVIHIFERERPGQWRGVPMLTAVLLNIYEMDELVDATIQRQKAAQAISWIIKNTSVTNAVAPGTVRQSVNPLELDSITGQRKVIIQGAGGNVQYLNKGEDITLSSLDDIGGNLQVLLEDEWSKISSALGLAYHQVTGDLSGVNFSSIRAGLNELRIRIEMVQEHLFITLGLKRVTSRFQELAGIYESAAMLTAIPYYYPPRRYGVDDLKDAQADLMEVQAGFATLESKLAERNTTFEDIVADRKRVETSGIKISSFPDSLLPEAVPTAAVVPTSEAATTKPNKVNPAKTKPSSPVKS
jgi:lambda family phage portal protein